MHISFIIPAYNAVATLERCLESVSPYLERGAEAVVVDDGSTDGTGVWADSYALSHPMVKVIHQANGGQSNARNLAIANAQGDFIWCLDSDDWLDATGIEDILSATTEDETEILYIGRHEEYANHSVETPKIYQMRFQTGVEFFRTASSQGIYRTQPWNMLVRTDLIRRTGIYFPENRMFEDVLWGISILLKARVVHMLPYHPYHYNLRDGGSLTHQVHPRDKDALWIIEKTVETIDQSHTGLRSEEAAVQWLIYRFVSSAILKKYVPLYYKNAEAKELVDTTTSHPLFRRALHFTASHASGLKQTIPAGMLTICPTLYKIILSIICKKD